MPSRLTGLLIPGLLFLLALLLRLAPLQRYVTPDEPAWVLRSLRFSQALSAGDLSAIPASGHPGVTTMWLGSLGLALQRLVAPQQAAAHAAWLDGLAGLSPQSAAAYPHLAFFLPGGRALVAVVTSLGLVGVYLMSRRLWGTPTALLATSWLALDPFLAGHSGLLHLDGLLATFMLLSALVLLLALRPSSTRAAPAFGWMAASGGLAGLAVLTKTPGGFLAPLVALTLVALVLMGRLSGRRALFGLLVWCAMAGVTFLLLYPALWSAPVATLQGMLDVGERHVEGALRPIFFHGQTTYDPSALYYPVVFLFRVSPLVLIGAALALLLLRRSRLSNFQDGHREERLLRRRSLQATQQIASPRENRPGLAMTRQIGNHCSSQRRLDAALLVLMAAGFAVFITLVGKKHDRYLLPALPPLTLVAALGWAEFGRIVSIRLRRDRFPLATSGQAVARTAPRDDHFRNGWTRTRLLDSLRSAPLLAIAPLVLFQAAMALPYVSTPLGYYNPLLGGPRAAVRWLDIGWGEGEGAAARWLNHYGEAGTWTVATASLPTFASLFQGQALPLDETSRYQTDYLVVPLRQGDAWPTSEEETGEPVFTAVVGGIPYVTVIRNPAPAAQAGYLQDAAGAGDAILLDAASPLQRLYSGPAEVAVLADAPDAEALVARLDALAAGHERWWVVSLPGASPITAAALHAAMDCRGSWVGSERVGGATISQLDLDSSPHCDAGDALPWRSYTFRLGAGGDVLGLTGAALPGEAASWPEPFSVTLRWKRVAPDCAGEGCGAPPAGLRALLTLQDEKGHTWLEGGGDILDGAYRGPEAWSPGQWSDQTFRLMPPAGIPPDRYTLALGVFHPASQVRMSVWDGAGGFAGLSGELGQVEIAPAEQPPALGEITEVEPFDPPVEAGPLRLLGSLPPPAQLPSGDRASFDLVWQAASAPDEEYMLRWRLFSAAGDSAAEENLPLSPYPTGRWRAGELERVRYDLVARPGLPAGDYRLAVNVLDAAGAPVWGTDRTLAQIQILARERSFDLPASIAYPLDYTLGQRVHLRGFDLDRVAVAPGGALSLTLYWQAEGPTELSYTVFVHLLGPDGMLHGQVDRLPAGGLAPTSSWAPGQVVSDALALPVEADAPPGAYQIAVGLYDPYSGGRLPVHDAGGELSLDGRILLPVTVQVER